VACCPDVGMSLREHGYRDPEGLDCHIHQNMSIMHDSCLFFGRVPGVLLLFSSQ
jgi:hypothetical protein